MDNEGDKMGSVACSHLDRYVDSPASFLRDCWTTALITLLLAPDASLQIQVVHEMRRMMWVTSNDNEEAAGHIT